MARLLTEGNIRKQLIEFAIPVFISSIFSELYTITNSMIVGNYCSLESLSAVSASSWIGNIFSYAFYGVGMGAGIVTAKYYGARDNENLKKSIDSIIVFGIVGGICLTLLSELFLPQMMKIINIADDIFDLSLRYLRYYLIGNTAVLTYQISFYILRSFGDTKHQLYYSIIGSIVNLLCGILFVRVFNMDVVGAALATIISQFVIDFLSLRLILNLSDEFRFDIKDIHFGFDIIWEVCRLGIPAGVQNMLIGISSMAVQSYVNMFPNEVIAGIGVGEKIAGWGQTFSYTCASGTMALVAQNTGAKKYDRVKETVKESIFLTTIMTTISVVAIFIFAPQLSSLFNPDASVIKYSTETIRFSVWSFFFLNLSHVYNGACRGAGNVKVPMYIAIFGQVICKYLFVFIGLKINFDVHVLYLGTAFGYTIAGLLATIYYHTSKWSNRYE